MNRRTKKVAHLIRAELSKLLLEDVSDPALQEITITEVRLSDDLKNAKTYYGMMASDVADAEVELGLEKANSYFRRKMGQNLDLRRVPDLEFEKDTHMDSVNRVLGLIESANQPVGSMR